LDLNHLLLEPPGPLPVHPHQEFLHLSTGSPSTRASLDLIRVPPSSSCFFNPQESLNIFPNNGREWGHARDSIQLIHSIQQVLSLDPSKWRSGPRLAAAVMGLRLDHVLELREKIQGLGCRNFGFRITRRILKSQLEEKSSVVQCSAHSPGLQPTSH